MRLNPRTTQTPTSPIAAAYEVLAERKSTTPLLDLSQAAPAYPPSDSVLAAVTQAVSENDTSRYAPSAGLEELRNEVAADLNRSFSSSVEAANVQITAGCNQAFCVVSSALAAPGDEIVITVPYYFNHSMWLNLDGVTPVHLGCDNNGVPSVDEAAALITNRTRAILLVTPGNPTGAICPPETIEAFYDLAAANGLVLIVDETYRTFTGSSDPTHDLYNRDDWGDTLVTLHSFSKDLAIPGYRVGAIVTGPDLINETLKISDCVAICAPRIGQIAAIAGLRDQSGWRQEQADRILGRLHTFRSIMAPEPGGFRLATSGAYFGWVKHPFASAGVDEVVRRLVLDADILAIPGTAFTPTDQGWLRFSFANLDTGQLTELGRRLAEF